MLSRSDFSIIHHPNTLRQTPMLKDVKLNPNRAQWNPSTTRPKSHGFPLQNNKKFIDCKTQNLKQRLCRDRLWRNRNHNSNNQSIACDIPQRGTSIQATTATLSVLIQNKRQKVNRIAHFGSNYKCSFLTGSHWRTDVVSSFRIMAGMPGIFGTATVPGL